MRYFITFILLVFSPLALAQDAADINVLVIGQSTDSSQVTFGATPTAAFQPVGIVDQLTNILEGGEHGAVNVDFVSSYGSFSFYLHANLFSWFHFPFTEGVTLDDRWANLRGELGTEWDYVVLIGDAHSMELMPGFYALGVSEIAKEVAKGTAETVLLMPWPGVDSTSSVDHYKEVVYRVGRTSGSLVAPAGLVWEASGEAVEASHPNDNGGYMAAATLYSRMFDKSAATSSYVYDDVLATLAHDTVVANKGAVQYTGRFAAEHPHKAQFNSNRNVDFSITGTSTERGHIDNLENVLDECRMNHSVEFSHRYNTDDPVAENSGWPTDEEGNPLGPIDYNFGKYNHAPYFQFGVNPDFWKRTYIFEYQFRLEEDTALASIHRHDIDSAMRAYQLGPYVGGTVPRSTWAMLYRLRPDLEMNTSEDRSNNHLTDIAILPNTSFINTIDSGRCPLTPETDNPTDEWTAMRVGYEAGWIMGNLQARAPGFRVLPSAADKQEINNYQTSGAEEMTVQFIFEPEEDVTVQLTSSHPELITINPSTLTFTPENHDVAQSYTVTIKSGAPTAEEEISVNVTTNSADEVYNGLSDSWTYTAKVRNVSAAPIAIEDIYSVDIDNVLTVVGNVGVTANDITNPLSPISQVTLENDVSHGALNLSNDGSFTYTPDTGFEGPDSFTYRVANANGSSEDVVVSIAVINDFDPSLLVWYEFEDVDGTTVKDSTVYERHGTSAGLLDQVTGVDVDKLALDVTGGSVEIPVDPEFEALFENEMTVAFWGYLNPITATSNSYMIRGYKTYGDTRNETLQARFNNNLDLDRSIIYWENGIYNESVGASQTFRTRRYSIFNLGKHSAGLIPLTPGLMLDRWVHWTFIINREPSSDAQTYRAYKDGILAFQGGLAGLNKIGKIGELDELFLGAGYHGNVDDFRIYNRDISVAEINQIILETAPPQPQSWTGNATEDNLWTTPGNWSLDETPRVGSTLEIGNGDVIDFPSGVTIPESSTVSLLDGELALGQGASLNLGPDAIFRIAGGSVTKDFADTNSDINFDGDATSLIEISSGSIQVVNGETGDFTELRSNIVVSGGDIDLSGQPRLRGNLTVRGSAATIDMEQLRTFTGAVFNFELDESGVSSINVNGATNIQDSSLSIDGSAYTGGDATIPLINASNLQNVIPEERVTVTGLEDRGYFVEVIQDRGTDDVVIEITADTADADEDGYLDWQEAIMGTDPADASSKLETAVVQTEAGLTLSWPTVSGRTYIVERSDDLNTWEVYRDNIPFTPGDNTAVEILAEAESESRMFYRVRVQN